MRINNWPSALIAHIEANRETRFSWGVHDCLLWAASCVEAITGEDPAGELRGSYSDPLAAYRIIKAAGGFEQLVESRIAGGASARTNVNLAMRGDIVTTTDSKGRMAAGVCDGAHGVFPGPLVLTFIRRNELNPKAWRVD